MSAPRKTQAKWPVILLLIAALALWARDQIQGTRPDSPTREVAANEGPPPEKPGREEKPTTSAKPSNPGTSVKPTWPSAPATTPGRTGVYETFAGCTLAEARDNDGDSFLAKLPDGRKVRVRLYFVDAPESAFKRYAGGDTNHERIRQQAAAFDGITPEQAVEVGKQAKAFTLGLLEKGPFTLHTVWDSPYQDERYHAFVEVRDGSRTRLLHELLVERGLVRIHTKPADLPDGTKVGEQRKRLMEMQRVARQAGKGAWGKS
jgi:endonuclease YncB( thermonuclease family)